LGLGTDLKEILKPSIDYSIFILMSLALPLVL